MRPVRTHLLKFGMVVAMICSAVPARAVLGQAATDSIELPPAYSPPASSHKPAIVAKIINVSPVLSGPTEQPLPQPPTSNLSVSATAKSSDRALEVAIVKQPSRRAAESAAARNQPKTGELRRSSPDSTTRDLFSSPPIFGSSPPGQRVPPHNSFLPAQPLEPEPPRLARAPGSELDPQRSPQTPANDRTPRQVLPDPQRRWMPNSEHPSMPRPIEPIPAPTEQRTVARDAATAMPTQLDYQPGAMHEQVCPPFSPFSPDPDYSYIPYQAQLELGIYHGKWCVPTQRPLIELWRPLYAPGEIPPSPALLGRKNLIHPHFLLFGDYRTGFAYNDNGGSDAEKFVWAHRLNLDFDFKITATERIHAFWGPLDEDNRFTRVEENNGQIELIEEFDEDFDTLFFEGDMGYIWGGLTDQYAPFDLPFVAGKYPLLFQNGVWLLDALEGFAFTIPAKNSSFFDWSNYDLTFFFAFDDVDSPAFGNDDNAADAYGFNGFVEANDGYWEIGYAFLEDKTDLGRSYNNIGLAYSRRYFHRISNSIRVILNAGQSPRDGVKTADGQLLLIENALISHDPLHFVPYMNMFAGFGNPQQVAGIAGVLVNTGINFESDGLTGYPTLDATANDTYGGAVGLNWLGPDFSWQLVTEFAMVKTHGNDPNRNAQNDQYGFGMRFQLPLTNAWLLRLDSMYGLIEDEPDVRGARMELRWKF